MAGSEELGLREDTVRVLAAFFRRGEPAGSPIPTPPRSPAQEEPTDFLSRLRRCLPCPLGRGTVPPESPRPCSLPLRPCYVSEPELQGAPPTEKEALLRKLVALLEEEAEVINQKVTGSLFHPLAKIGIADCQALGSEPGSAFSLDGQLASDPALRRKLARLSAGSFARLVELFSKREDSPLASRPRPNLPCPGPPPPSPEPLARLALAMELSRRVARLGGTLAGLSVEHVHSFGPWIQAHGGWEGILAISPVDLNLPLD
ncbi:bcl-2-like protein 12 isoform X1 [Mirounga angustirostris]|uniref:bcl-2-like protein 12 isoform X1 n=1 Tax=Mirounga angustirostris TaxID=9716 RepID=UPI00313DE7BA